MILDGFFVDRGIADLDCEKEPVGPRCPALLVRVAQAVSCRLLRCASIVCHVARQDINDFAMTK